VKAGDLVVVAEKKDQGPLAFDWSLAAFFVGRRREELQDAQT
jgi:hypothetical protein